MKFVALILFLAAAGTALQTPAPAGRRDWVDPATGHRVIRISDDPGSSTLYFHDNAFSAAGDRMMLRTPKGVAVVEVARLGGEDLKLDVVAPQAGGGYFARRGRDIYLRDGAGNAGSGRSAGSVKAVNIDTRVAREVANATGLINADETRHEGTWHAVDRTWTIRADGSALRAESTAGDRHVYAVEIARQK